VRRKIAAGPAGSGIPAGFFSMRIQRRDVFMMA